jgi:hypothetical protein
MTNTVASISYTQQTTSTQNISLETEVRSFLTAEGHLRVEEWVNLNTVAQPEINTVTIATPLPTNDCNYSIEVIGPTETKKYLHQHLTAGSETGSDIAADLATIVSTHADVSAVQGTTPNTGDIVITSVLPGTAGGVTVNVACSQLTNNTAITSKIAVAETQAASGTGKLRKIAEVQVELASTGQNPPFPQMIMRGARFFNGAAVPTQIGSEWTAFPATGSKSFVDLIATP